MPALSILLTIAGTALKNLKLVIEKMFPRIAKKVKDKMIGELKDWPPKIELDFDGSKEKSDTDENPDGDKESSE